MSILPAGIGSRSGIPPINNSLRCRANASAYLNKTFGSPSSSSIWTLSLWVKRGALGTNQRLFGASTNTYLTFNTSDQLNLTLNGVSACTSTAVFRDPFAWCHIVYQQNGSAQTLYVDGNVVASGTTAAAVFNTAIAHQIGAANTSNHFDGLISRICFVDGSALTPNSFGRINPSTNQWVSKSAGACKAVVDAGGTNSFMLDFDDVSSLTTLGNDYSSKNNDWSLNNFSLTSGITYDWMTDTPTNNYAVLNPLDKVGTATLAAANLQTASAVSQVAIGSFGMTSGKWYWECAYSAATSTQSVGVYGTSSVTASITPTTSVIGIKFDADAGTLSYTTDGTNYTSISTGLTSGPYFPYMSSATNSKAMYFNAGQRPFSYTPPTGHKSPCTSNLPTPAIKKPELHFDVLTYTGQETNLNTNTVRALDFSPGLVWEKSRASGYHHFLTDSVRGAAKVLSSSQTAAESSWADNAFFSSINSDGVTVKGNTGTCDGGDTHIIWTWKAGDAAVANNSGSISSQVSANQTAGFSIVTYTGTGANATVGHGLGVVPKMIVVKDREGANDWAVYHAGVASDPQTDYLLLNSTAAVADLNTYWNDTAPTSTVFSIGTNVDVNSVNDFVAYCFAEVPGFSKFGKYIGNASADGPFVHLGFKPKFLMTKRIDSTSSWIIVDGTRSQTNVVDDYLIPNASSAESNATFVDFLSNGFKLRGSTHNESGAGFIYAAFAEAPFNYSNAR